MKEYIEREALIEALKRECPNLYYASEHELIRTFPAADVAPVIHAYWIDTDCFDAHYQPIYECSHCNKQVADNYISCHKHCLHCGAKMDGGNK